MQARHCSVPVMQGTFSHATSLSSAGGGSTVVGWSAGVGCFERVDQFSAVWPMWERHTATQPKTRSPKRVQLEPKTKEKGERLSNVQGWRVTPITEDCRHTWGDVVAKDPSTIINTLSSSSTLHVNPSKDCPSTVSIDALWRITNLVAASGKRTGLLNSAQRGEERENKFGLHCCWFKSRQGWEGKRKWSLWWNLEVFNCTINFTALTRLLYFTLMNLWNDEKKKRGGRGGLLVLWLYDSMSNAVI